MPIEVVVNYTQNVHYQNTILIDQSELDDWAASTYPDGTDKSRTELIGEYLTDPEEYGIQDGAEEVDNDGIERIKINVTEWTA